MITALIIGKNRTVVITRATKGISNKYSSLPTTTSSIPTTTSADPCADMNNICDGLWVGLYNTIQMMLNEYSNPN